MMYGRAFSVVAMARCYENGHGSALQDKQGRFFCGYKQDDGSIYFHNYKQVLNQEGAAVVVKLDSARGYSTDRPVLLSVEDMKAQGVGAAAYRLLADAYEEKGSLPADLMKEGKWVRVSKDLTFDAQAQSGPVSVYDYNNAPGLASAEACETGEVQGYISLSKQFGSQVRAARNAFASLLGRKPSGPAV